MADTTILFIHPSDELYGADRMLLEVLEALPEGLSAEVWLPEDLEHPGSPLCEVLDSEGVPNRHVDLPVLRRAYRTPASLARLARRAQRLRRELRAAHPQMVYCTTSAAFIAAPVARMSGVPRIVGHLQEIWSASDRRVLSPLANYCDHLLAISGAVADEVTERVRRKTVVVPNATPTPPAFGSVASHRGPLRFLIASRWNSWKGHRTLLEAWDRLPDPGHLTILGGPPSSGESVDVRALVACLRRPDSVSVVGEVSDPSDYIDEADVVLMPSDHPEPFGLVAIEAFARGRPVVASAGGGLLDIVTAGANGWLFPPGDPVALADLLAALDRDAVTAAGMHARATYLDHFTGAAFAERWRRAMQFENVDPNREVGQEFTQERFAALTELT